MKSLRQSFAEQHPEFPLLELHDVEGVAALVQKLGWLETDERIVSVEKPGEGNMNLTLRLITDRRSLILKQSRPWVEKYDFIAAPLDRMLAEMHFYRRVASLPTVAAAMPKLLAADRQSRLLLLEDLGGGADLSSLYTRGGGAQSALVDSEAEQLGGFLADLHEGTRGQEPGPLSNPEMRALNAEHIFAVPMQEDNGVDLEGFEPGLAAAAALLRGDLAFRSALAELEERYLSVLGPSLVHGDFFPGSWLRTERGLCVIDPEFAFFGDPELDLGVASAHLVLAGQGRRLAEILLDHACLRQRSQELVAKYAGAEAMRRILGVAQLPLAPSRGRRARLLTAARAALVEGSLTDLLGVTD